MIRRFSEKYGETVLLLVLIVASLFLITVGLDIPTGRSRAIITPATWPLMSLGIIVGSAALLLLFKSINRKRDELVAKASEEDGVGDAAEEENIYPQRALYTILFMIVYLGALPYVGFIPITLVAMGCFMLSINVSRLFSLVIPVVMILIVVSVFGIGLKVPLPRGFGIFRDFSMLFY